MYKEVLKAEQKELLPILLISIYLQIKILYEKALKTF